MNSVWAVLSVYSLSLQHTQWQHFVSGTSADLKASCKEIDYYVCHFILYSTQNEPDNSQTSHEEKSTTGIYCYIYTYTHTCTCMHSVLCLSAASRTDCRDGLIIASDNQPRRKLGNISVMDEVCNTHSKHTYQNSFMVSNIHIGMNTHSLSFICVCVCCLIQLMCLEEIGSSMDSDALASQEVSFTPNGTHNSYIEIHMHIHVKLACGLYYCGWYVFPP